MSYSDDNRGLTLIELLASIGIFALLIGSIVTVYLSSNQAQKAVWNELNAQSEGRRFAKAFTAELRTAATANTGAYALEKVAPQEIIFYSNIDTDTWRERVRYFMSGTTLKKGIIKPAGNPPAYNTMNETVSEVLHNMANGTAPVFLYYDENFTGTEAALPEPVDTAKVRAVGASVSLKRELSASSTPLKIETVVEVRNLKSN